MQRFPNNRFSNNLSDEDRRTYRRRVRGLFLFYVGAIGVAIGITSINRPASELRASNETQTDRLKATTGSVSSTARLLARP